MPPASPYRTVIESMFQIVDKDGAKVDFRLNSVQARLDAHWSRRNIIPKARQGGISSYVIARYVAKCLTIDNRTCVIISHEADATQRLLARAYYILDNLKGGVKPVLGRHSRNEIHFKSRNSTIYIGTAGSKTFGHGDTITDLHLSEAARYPDPDAIVRGTFPAAERGEITVESTGNGVGNWYHRQCVRAREGVGFALHFFSWLDMPEYALPFADDDARQAFAVSLREDLEEPKLLAAGVTPEQLAWRRERLTIDYELDLRAFKEAYPFDFDECFQSTGYGFFRRINFVQTDKWVRRNLSLWEHADHPKRDRTYVIGGDPAGGVGANNSVAQVFCLEEACQVAEFVSAYVEPDQFGDAIAALARKFNHAYVNVERNNHGLTTIARLVAIYPTWLVHRNTHGEQVAQEVLSRLSHYGTLTGPANRGIIIGRLRTMLAAQVTIHSPLLKSELQTFIEKEDGKVEADSGCLDDRVMAAAMAAVAFERAGIVSDADRTQATAPADPDPFSFDGMFGKQPAPTGMGGLPERFH